MQGYRPTIVINILALLVGCVVTFCFVGRDGGTGKATAGNTAAEESAAKDAIAKDVPAKAATGFPVAAAAAAPAGDAMSGTSIPGSPDRFLDLPGEPVTATPLVPDFRPEDYGHNLVQAHNDVNPDSGELYDRTTRQLWAVSITTHAVYGVEQLYLDARDRRLYMKTVKEPGEPAMWGHFSLTDSFTSEMQQAGRLEFTAGDGVRRIFVLAGSSASTGQ